MPLSSCVKQSEVIPVSRMASNQSRSPSVFFLEIQTHRGLPGQQWAKDSWRLCTNGPVILLYMCAHSHWSWARMCGLIWMMRCHYGRAMHPLVRFAVTEALVGDLPGKTLPRYASSSRSHGGEWRRKRNLTCCCKISARFRSLFSTFAIILLLVLAFYGLAHGRSSASWDRIPDVSRVNVLEGFRLLRNRDGVLIIKDYVIYFHEHKQNLANLLA